MSEKLETLAGAMALAFAEIEAVTKSNENPAFKQQGQPIKYANLTAVIEAIKPPLIAHGLFFTQRPEPSDNGVTVETFLHHRGGEQLSLGKLYVPANNHNAQGFGSALTYARRYALVTAFGVPVEDDDGNAASQGAKPAIAQAPPSTISEAQRTELMLLLDTSNVPVGEFLQVGNLSDLREMHPDEFENAKRWIAKKAKENAK